MHLPSSLLVYVFQAIEKSPQSEYTVAQIAKNKARNRFANIFPCKSVAGPTAERLYLLWTHNLVVLADLSMVKRQARLCMMATK